MEVSESFNCNKNFDPVPVEKNPVNAESSALFKKYVIKKGDEIPNKLDLKGCFIITRDAKHVGLLHMVFWIAQKVHAFLFRKEIDINFCHGMIALGRNENDIEKKDHLILAHAVFDGILTSRRNYLKDADVTDIVIYQPTDENIRNLLKQHAEQTAYNRKVPKKMEKAAFSLVDIGRAFFGRPQPVVNTAAWEKSRKRLAYATADLMMGKQLYNEEGTKLQSYFCVAYALTVLQSSYVVNALKDTITAEGKTREELANEILTQLSDKDIISKEFMKLDARFAMSAHTASCLDEASEVVASK